MAKEEQAIPGTQTVIDDNPKLDIRDWTGNNPIRLVLIKISIPSNSNVFENQSKTIILQKKRQGINKKNLP
jgi:diaminohydroxyphosphoribosylaminopyrimidine deaminase/5-amino-6-(5-phosphoribosylamino)uracil reductase